MPRAIPIRLSSLSLRPVRAFLPTACAGLVLACVPPGNSTPSDAGTTTATQAAAAPTYKPSDPVVTIPYEDNFERTAGASRPAITALSVPSATASASGSGSASAGEAGAAPPSSAASANASDSAAPIADNPLGPDWYQAGTNVWHLEDGKLCGQNAKNHGVWLKRTIPVNARIEFDAISDALDGDLKVEVWGDGKSAATSISYTNATSYLVIFGGWKNTFHVIARINEHAKAGEGREEIAIDKTSDDPREHPVVAGQTYHFKVERTDGHTVRWFVDNTEMLSFNDTQPLSGAGHDHFGFNDWDAKVCFDNVRITPL